MPFIVDGTAGGFFPSWTTATRPASPAVGQMGYNTTTGLFDNYTAAGWTSVLTNASQSIPFAALPAGSVLQVVQTTSSTQANTTSLTPVATGFTASITPKFSTSKILITFSTTTLGQSGAECGTFVYRATTAITGKINSAGVSVIADVWTPLSVTYLDSPATTSSTTYNIYFQRNAAVGTAYMGSSPGSTNFFTLMEIAA